jgi:hypothetical protein
VGGGARWLQAHVRTVVGDEWTHALGQTLRGAFSVNLVDSTASADDTAHMQL